MPVRAVAEIAPTGPLQGESQQHFRHRNASQLIDAAFCCCPMRCDLECLHAGKVAPATDPMTIGRVQSRLEAQGIKTASCNVVGVLKGQHRITQQRDSHQDK